MARWRCWRHDYLPLGQGLALVAYLFLTWLTEGARWFARVPGAAVQLPPFPLWLLLAYYTIVIGGWLWGMGPQRGPWLPGAYSNEMAGLAAVESR